KRPAVIRLSLLARQRPAAVARLALARRVGEIEFLLVETNSMIENHFHSGSLGEHSIRTARHQHGDQSRSGSRGRADSRTHPTGTTQTARNGTNARSSGRSLAYSTSVTCFITLTANLAF